MIECQRLSLGVLDEAAYVIREAKTQFLFEVGPELDDLAPVAPRRCQ